MGWGALLWEWDGEFSFSRESRFGSFWVCFLGLEDNGFFGGVGLDIWEMGDLRRGKGRGEGKEDKSDNAEK